MYSTVASEETPNETHVGNGPFSLACDPLDGSSIIDANFSVGSVYGIWPGTTLLGRMGREQVAAAVALYGPRTLLCIALAATATAGGTTTATTTGTSTTTGAAVLEVTLVRNRSEWEVSRSNVHMEDEGRIFAPGNLRATADHSRYAALVQYWITNAYQLRYSGGMVPDVYHIFAKSRGVFTNVSSPKCPAKLRLLYEVAPLGFIVECAGGSAMEEGCEQRSVLDIVIDNMDHRMGVCFGSKKEVEIYKKIMFDDQVGK